VTVRPEDLARDLGVSGKVLRGWLRSRYPRSAAEKSQPWYLNDSQVRGARAHFGGAEWAERRTVPNSALSRSSERTAPVRARATSDEHYVVDLCDEVLGQRGARQHRFPWLVGDSGTSLPVDAYYAHHQLVVEYRERQHTEAVPFFDRRMTVSGVGRGEQRALYDRRREEEIPRHGLRLVVVMAAELDADRRGRLRRSREHDLAVLRRRLAKRKR
jgi:hypothetical protein